MRKLKKNSLRKQLDLFEGIEPEISEFFRKDAEAVKAVCDEIAAKDKLVFDALQESMKKESAQLDALLVLKTE